MSSCSFRVQCSNNLSSSRTSSCGVSSRFCPWPYTFYHVYTTPTKYTNPISIAQPSPVCRLYTAFSSLFIHPIFTLAKLQTALQEISFWMTANLLTLNSSKTEFLLIRLKQQLAKIQNCPLSITHCSQPGLHLWWTSFFFLPDNCTFQVMQLPHSSNPLYPPIPWYQNTSIVHALGDSPLSQRAAIAKVAIAM